MFLSVPRGKHLDVGEEPCGVWGHHYSQVAGDYFVVPFVTTLTLLSHFPQSATFLSASQQLPYPEEISLESPGSQGSGFPVLSRSAPEKSEAKSGLQKRTQAKWGCGLGRGRVGAGLSQRLEPTTAFHLSPNSTPNTPQLPTFPHLSPHLLGLIISHN